MGGELECGCGRVGSVGVWEECGSVDGVGREGGREEVKMGGELECRWGRVGSVGVWMGSGGKEGGREEVRMGGELECGWGRVGSVGGSVGGVWECGRECGESVRVWEGDGVTVSRPVLPHFGEVSLD
ncbi:hypothetical protein Pcinc_032020 [Petrolisthes cinctipes]|uniref:Uncharacterized protein n=1 Tax=Petrolisthes cinctipes TaxID=88211 RepID=A0AAE1EVD2_PETCI|nr:hypothetical protein Pcinc_032020 [Petrolisthes cinctipes]